MRTLASFALAALVVSTQAIAESPKTIPHDFAKWEKAVAAFEKAGVPVHPVACDFQVLRFREPTAGWKAFPDEEALSMFSIWWHEQLGWLAYRLLGHL